MPHTITTSLFTPFGNYTSHFTFDRIDKYKPFFTMFGIFCLLHFWNQLHRIFEECVKTCACSTYVGYNPSIRLYAIVIGFTFFHSYNKNTHVTSVLCKHRYVDLRCTTRNTTRIHFIPNVDDIACVYQRNNYDLRGGFFFLYFKNHIIRNTNRANATNTAKTIAAICAVLLFAAADGSIHKPI